MTSLIDTVIARNYFYEPVASKEFVKSARSWTVCIGGALKAFLIDADFAEHVQLEPPWVLYQTVDI